MMVSIHVNGGGEKGNRNNKDQLQSTADSGVGNMWNHFQKAVDGKAGTERMGGNMKHRLSGWAVL